MKRLSWPGQRDKRMGRFSSRTPANRPRLKSAGGVESGRLLFCNLKTRCNKSDYGYSSAMRVLFVEDDRKIISFVKKGLKEQGFVVDVCEDGDEGYALAVGQAYDVILLDIMLPGRDGLTILRQLRDMKNTVPVILLTARSALSERVEGLNLGADDYLSKPFYIEELFARIHAVTRRGTGQQLSLLQDGDMVVNLITREVRTDRGNVELTAREFNLLALLMRSPGRVYTRTQILEHVWGYFFDPQTNVVDVYIRRLRSKMDTDPGRLRIETVRGVGYRFNKISKE